MAAATVECPNRAVNLQMCPCPQTDCEQRGICCVCVQTHAAKGERSYCLDGAERPAASRSLSGRGIPCDRYDANLEFCPCDYDPCTNRGTCCDCVRNHWGDASSPVPACMR